MMPFYYNSKKGIYVETEEGHEDHKRIQFFRNWSAFVVNEEGTLDSIQLGRYTKFTGVLDESKLKWNEDGTAVDPEALRAMLFQDQWLKVNLGDTLLDEDDVVLMEDQTWKKAQDLEVGDKVQAISIPVSGTVDIREHIEDYNVSYEEFAEESHWVVNEIQNVHKIEAWYDEVVFKFADGTDWYDTAQSSYPTLDPEDSSVKFVTLGNLKTGDKIILMPVDAESLENPTFVVKEVASVSVRRKLQRGYSISLDGNHLFLSKTSEDTLAYIAIEHNADLGHTIYLCGLGATREEAQIFAADELLGEPDSCPEYNRPPLCMYSETDPLWGQSEPIMRYFADCRKIGCNFVARTFCIKSS